MSFDPYLYFDGTCREAMSWYAAVFGAEATYMMTYAEAPDTAGMPPGDDRILHACITVDGRMLMASDLPAGQGGGAQQGVGISHACRTRTEAEALFDTLAEGGEVQMPFADVFWADGFGMLRDRFGTHWLIGGPSKM